MKRILSMFLVLSLMLGLLAGCKGGDGGETTNAPTVDKGTEGGENDEFPLIFSHHKRCS